MGWKGRMGWTVLTFAVVAMALDVSVFTQASFESVVADLGSPDSSTRLKAVQLLKGTGYPEAAVPLARVITDPVDEIQLEAIDAELNIFLAEKVTPRRRVGLIIEVRRRIAAEPIFSAGPSALGADRVPAEVVAALANASRDPNARVAVEALYAFGALAGEVTAADRPAVLAQSGQVLAATIGATDPMLRLAAIKVIGRVFARRAGDPPIDESVGDAVILALNDRESIIQQAAMWALGVMRYERAIQGLNELLQYHQKGPLAESAFDALARIGHRSSLPQFVTQLNGKNLTFKMIAIEGLARMGDRARADTIQLALNDEKNDAVLLAGHFANVRLSDGPVDVIVDSLTRGKLRDQALQYVYEVAAGRAAMFSRHLQDPDERVRLDLVEALGMSGDQAALPVVEPLTKDRDEEVARAAARAVARSERRPSFVKRRLPRSFYDRPTLEVAGDLLGKVLVHRRQGVVTSGVIVEVEAYIGESDPASHAAVGRTPRNAPMYGRPGFVYVYLNYGIHHLVNIVTEAVDAPAAVLIRALDPIDGISTMRRRRGRTMVGRRSIDVSEIGLQDLCRGPGNVTMAMGITQAENQCDLVSDRLFVEDRGIEVGPVQWGPRVGIRVGVDLPWRAYMDGHAAVSVLKKPKR